MASCILCEYFIYYSMVDMAVSSKIIDFFIIEAKPFNYTFRQVKILEDKSNKKGLEKLLGMRVVGVRNLEEALDELF